MQRSARGPVLASALKRAILRKDPTFLESEYGFRGFLELVRNLESRGVVRLGQGGATGDPEVQLPDNLSGEDEAFGLLHRVVDELGSGRDRRPVVLSGLKNMLRKKDPQFSEKQFGYSGFLQFCQAAKARGFVDLDWDDARRRLRAPPRHRRLSGQATGPSKTRSAARMVGATQGLGQGQRRLRARRLPAVAEVREQLGHRRRNAHQGG